MRVRPRFDQGAWGHCTFRAQPGSGDLLERILGSDCTAIAIMIGSSSTRDSQVNAHVSVGLVFKTGGLT